MARIVQVSQHLHSNPSLNHNHLVITPNPRAARALGVPHRSLHHQALRVIRRQGWNEVSAIIGQEVLKKGIRKTAEVKDVAGTARVILPVIREIFRAGIHLEQLRKESSPRIQQVAHIALQYQTLLRKEKLLDTAEIIVQASHWIEEPEPVLVTGHPRFNQDELAFINACAADHSIVTLPSGDAPLFAENQQALRFFQENGWEIQQAENSQNTFSLQLSSSFLFQTKAPQSCNAWIFPDMEAEIRGALAQVKAFLHQDVPASQIVLITQDESAYTPLVLSIADEYQIPVNSLYQIPLLESRFGAWVSQLLECIQHGLPFESTIQLLSHPIGEQIRSYQDYETSWQFLRTKHPSGLQEWQEREIDLRLLDWNNLGSRDDFITRLREIFRAFHIQARCAYWARETIAYQTFEDGLEELSQRPNEIISLQQFLDEVQEVLTLLTVPIRPGTGGVELHTPLAVCGAAYDHVFVLGAAEGVLPAPVQDSVILDYHERQQLIRKGFPLKDAIRAAQREQLQFWSLLCTGRKSFIISCPQVLNQREMLPSPFIQRLSLQVQQPEFCYIASREEYQSCFLLQNHNPENLSLPLHLWQIEWNREHAPLQDEYDGNIQMELDHEELVFSVAQLTQLGQCPFKWFMGYVLRLQKPDEAETELSHLTRGDFFHRVLHILTMVLPDGCDVRQWMIEHLPEAFEKVEQEMNMQRLSLWEYCRDEYLQTLTRAIQGEHFISDDRSILNSEKTFSFDWHGLKIVGKIDRIDTNQDALVVMDYKSGSSRPTGIKTRDNKASVDLQLQIYKDAVLSENHGTSVEDVYYYSISKARKIGQGKDAREFDYEAFARQVKLRIQQGNFSIFPDEAEEACKYCPYDLICRKGIRLQRKGTDAWL